MTKHSKPICLLLLLAFSITACNGQINRPKDSVSEHGIIKKGTSKLEKTQGTGQYANIYSGLLDKAGNLWFGTMGEGVYRYDGKSFTQFTVKDGLCNNYVYSIMEDKTGNLWLGTAYGVCRYNGKDFTSVPIIVTDHRNSLTYTLPGNKFTVNMYGVPSMENTVWSVMQDKKGDLWFGTTKGVFCYNGIFFTRFLDNKDLVNTDSLHLRMVTSMLEDRSGNIWFCSGMLPGNEGICRYDGKSMIRFKPDNEGWVRKVIESKDGNLYFVTRHNGIYRYDGKSFINFTEKGGIGNSSVTTAIEDKTGNFWIGTELGSGELGEDGGLWHYDGKSFTRFTTRDGLIHNGIYCIVEDRAGNVWIGTRNIGLSRYDRKDFTSFSE